MTECERGTQRKTERLIEHFASIALFVALTPLEEGGDICGMRSTIEDRDYLYTRVIIR